MKFYTLNELGNPVHEPDKKKWDAWFSQLVATNRHIVAKTILGRIIVNTIFLGHGLDEEADPPAVWETQVFGGLLDQVKDRCAGPREHAETMHNEMVQRVQENLKP